VARERVGTSQTHRHSVRYFGGAHVGVGGYRGVRYGMVEVEPAQSATSLLCLPTQEPGTAMMGKQPSSDGPPGSTAQPSASAFIRCTVPTPTPQIEAIFRMPC
jgi:hypothetical protein